MTDLSAQNEQAPSAPWHGFGVLGPADIIAVASILTTAHCDNIAKAHTAAHHLIDNTMGALTRLIAAYVAGFTDYMESIREITRSHGQAPHIVAATERNPSIETRVGAATSRQVADEGLDNTENTPSGLLLARIRACTNPAEIIAEQVVALDAAEARRREALDTLSACLIGYQSLHEAPDPCGQDPNEGLPELKKALARYIANCENHRAVLVGAASAMDAILPPHHPSRLAIEEIRTVCGEPLTATIPAALAAGRPPEPLTLRQG